MSVSLDRGSASANIQAIVRPCSVEVPNLSTDELDLFRSKSTISSLQLPELGSSGSQISSARIGAVSALMRNSRGTVSESSSGPPSLKEGAVAVSSENGVSPAAKRPKRSAKGTPDVSIRGRKRARSKENPARVVGNGSRNLKKRKWLGQNTAKRNCVAVNGEVSRTSFLLLSFLFFVCC